MPARRAFRCRRALPSGAWLRCAPLRRLDRPARAAAPGRRPEGYSLASDRRTSPR